MRSDLKTLQSLLYRLITAPEGVAQGLERERSLAVRGLDDVIVGDERLSAEARVEIYANMYFYRILDALKEDFYATLAVVGDENFHNLVTDYLIHHPPTHYSIGEAGRFLAAFVRGHSLGRAHPYLADLAALEWAIIESFHADDPPSLDAETMRQIAPEKWPALRLATHPAVRLPTFDYRVDRLLAEVEGGDKWHPPARERSPTLVWRNRSRVYYRALEISEFSALDTASSAATFAEICGRFASAMTGGDVASEINKKLSSWLGDGLLTLAAD